MSSAAATASGTAAVTTSDSAAVETSGTAAVTTSDSAAVETSGPETAGPGTAGTGALPADCAPATLATKTAGKLTIATSEPAYEPWMVDNDPTNGKGLESAVAYAVADKLGFTKGDVTWTRAVRSTAWSSTCPRRSA